MVTTHSSSPSDSTQFFTKPLPAAAQTTRLVEQQLRLSVESPQLLAAIEILLPLAKTVYGELSRPRSSGCDPRTAELINSSQGGAGPGVSRSRRPLGSDLSIEPGDLPPPRSPAARYLSQHDLSNRYLAENDTGNVNSDTVTAGTGAGTKISDDELGKAMAQDAKDMVGKPALGAECFDLPDQLLEKNGGKSANDFHHVTGSRKQDYVWGTSAEASTMSEKVIRPSFATIL